MVSLTVFNWVTKSQDKVIFDNLKSCKDLPLVICEKIQKEVALGRIKGPFQLPSLLDFRISPIGVVPKRLWASIGSYIISAIQRDL